MPAVIDLSSYKTIIFDCDGVVLDSNFVKAEAFALLAMPYGREVSLSLMEYHLKNPAVTRHVKIQYLIDHLLPRYGFQGPYPIFESLLRDFALLLSSGLRSCELDPSLSALRDLTRSSSWLMASGAEEVELRNIMSYHKVDLLFDLGIYGGPTSKVDILTSKLRAGQIEQPSLFVGDSFYDFECSRAVGADFVYVSHWTCETEWTSFVSKYDIFAVDSLGCLVDYCRSLGNETA